MWEVEFTEEFERWWQMLGQDEQESLLVGVKLVRHTWKSCAGKV